MTTKAKEPVLIELSRDHALILFEMLARSSKAPRIEIDDEAERRVLWDLECKLEEKMVEPFREDYDRLLAEAKDRTRGTGGSQ